MVSVALVLGAGGMTGAAWHGAVLAALDEAGWDARRADLIVGTSAGSGVGATLRAGLPPADLVAGILGRELSPEGRRVAGRAGERSAVPDASQALRLGARRPSEPLLGLRSILSGVLPRPAVALAGLLPEGRLPTEPVGARLARLHPDRWPEDPYWACAVRLRDGARVVFGRDLLDAPVATAVEASSAIPGFFAPVAYAGQRYIDGGTHSPTNADLVAGLGFDLVVVSSPMSATSAAVRARPLSPRPVHARRLASEVAAIKEAGSAVLAFQPDPDTVAAMGVRAMEPSRRAPVARAALQSMRRHLSRPEIATRLPRTDG